MTEEEWVLVSVEWDPQYENVNPGTVTVEGFGMECWDHEHNHGKPRNRAGIAYGGALPSVNVPQLLRRHDEVRKGSQQLGKNQKLDYDKLVAMLGPMAYVSLVCKCPT